MLRRADAAAAYVEEKGLAVAVHTRRLPDAAAARDRLVEPMRARWPSGTGWCSSPAAT